MQEKLSIKKVYRNAYRYVASHLFAFAFLTIFYFFGQPAADDIRLFSLSGAFRWRITTVLLFLLRVLL